MNKLKLDAQVKVIGALVEGCSIRSVERMTGIHRDTIMRLSVRVGEACAKVMDEQMRGLTCERVQVDELWCYVGKKQRRSTAEEKIIVDDNQKAYRCLWKDCGFTTKHRTGVKRVSIG